MSPGERIRFTMITVAALLVVAACTSGGDTSSSTTAGLFAPDFEPISIEATDCDYGGLLRRISADNRLTVRFELCRSDVTLGSKVASPALGALPSQLLDAAASDLGLLERPIGTGPYRLGDRGDEELRMDRFDGYHLGPAETGTLVFRWDGDASRRLATVQAGSADGIDLPPPAERDTIDADSDLDLYPRTGVNLTYLGLDTDHEALSDRNVRRAIALALDRSLIVGEAFPLQSTPSEQTLPSSLAGWTPTPVWPEPDAAAAGAVLGTVGGGLAIAYAEPEAGALVDTGRVAAAVQAQLAEAGLAVEVESMSTGDFGAALDAGDVPMFVDTWLATTPDVAAFFDEMFMGDASARFGSDLADVQAAVVGARLGDADQRYVANEFVGDAVIDAVPLIPLGHVDSAAVYRADVEDTRVVRFGLDEFQPTASPVGAEYFFAMDPGGRDEFVWIQEAEPGTLFCAAAADVATLRACAQITESLLRFETGSGEINNGITEAWSANEDATIWTFRLLDGIEFHDGSHLDAGDVVRTLALQWDSTDPLHSGDFPAFGSMFGEPLGPGDKAGG